MAPTKMTTCKFFAQGFCKYRDSCDFIHGQHTRTAALPGIEGLSINLAVPTHLNEEAKPPRICTFFMQGSCNMGDKCWYVHPPAIARPQQIHPNAISSDSYPGQQDKDSLQAPSDSRASVLCKFLSYPGGCQNGSSCPYLHPVGDHQMEESSSCDFEDNEDEASSTSLTYAEVHINTIDRTKSVTTILLEIFPEHQPTLMNSATFSKSPYRQTSPLHALQVLHQELLLEQSSIFFVA